MKTSIIIANYNKNILLKSLLKSIQVQLRGEEDEVIVIDDASTDNSVQIVKEFPFKLIENIRNIGPAASRNKGVNASSGELLIFCDSDTCWEPGTLTRIKSWFEDENVGALTGNLSKAPIDQKWCGYFYLLEEHENLTQADFETGSVSYWSSTLGVIRRTVFINAGGFDESYLGADIEDLLLGEAVAKESVIIFDKELEFHHNYSSLPLIIYKALTRTSQIIEKSFTPKNNPLIQNSFRKIGYILSFLILTTIPFPKLFPILVLAKVFYHRIYFKEALKKLGILFCLYSLGAMYLTAFAVALGIIWGYLKKYFRVLAPTAG